MAYRPAGYSSPAYHATPFFALPEPDATLARDWDLVRDLRDRLEAGGAFDAVLLGAPAEVDWPAQANRCAWLTIADVEELDDVPETSLRTLRIGVELRVRGAAVDARNDAVDRLVSAVHNAADRESLAGVSLPPLTRVRRGRLAPGRHPEAPYSLTVEAPYFIHNAEGHYEGD